MFYHHVVAKRQVACPQRADVADYHAERRVRNAELGARSTEVRIFNHHVAAKRQVATYPPASGGRMTWQITPAFALKLRRGRPAFALKLRRGRPAFALKLRRGRQDEHDVDKERMLHESRARGASRFMQRYF